MWFVLSWIIFWVWFFWGWLIFVGFGMEIVFFFELGIEICWMIGVVEELIVELVDMILLSNWLICCWVDFGNCFVDCFVLFVGGILGFILFINWLILGVVSLWLVGDCWLLLLWVFWIFIIWCFRFCFLVLILLMLCWCLIWMVVNFFFCFVVICFRFWNMISWLL